MKKIESKLNNFKTLTRAELKNVIGGFPPPPTCGSHATCVSLGYAATDCCVQAKCIGCIND